MERAMYVAIVSGYAYGMFATVNEASAWMASKGLEGTISRLYETD